MKLDRGVLVAMALGGALAVQASPNVSVEAVQAPAWVVRGEQRLPLVPGQELKNHDRLETGGDARVLLRLAEGSAVKLGENATLKVDALGRREGNVFTAAFDVVSGAFRFTTGIFSKAHNKRAVNVRVATITAGIRGTDLWGSSDAERDLICLLEGRITVTHPEAEPVLMDEPFSFYVAPMGLAPKPVSAADPAQVAQWAEETEARTGHGVARRNGAWKVQFATADDEATALAMYDRGRAAGYPVRIKPVADGAGGYRYDLRVPNLATKADAEALATRLRPDIGVESTKSVRF